MRCLNIPNLIALRLSVYYMGHSKYLSVLTHKITFLHSFPKQKKDTLLASSKKSYLNRVKPINWPGHISMWFLFQIWYTKCEMSVQKNACKQLTRLVLNHCSKNIYSSSYFFKRWKKLLKTLFSIGVGQAVLVIIQTRACKRQTGPGRKKMKALLFWRTFSFQRERKDFSPLPHSCPWLCLCLAVGTDHLVARPE